MARTTALYLVLLILPVVLRFVPGRRRESERWIWRLDAPLMLGVSLLSATLAAGWLTQFHMPAGGVSGQDFGEFCTSVESLGFGHTQHYSQNRSLLAGAPPALLTRIFGILDAFMAAGWLCVLATGLGLYLWGRAVHGRLAGCLAVLLSGAVAPLVMMTRTTSFYPEFVAVFTLGAGLCALTLRWASPWAFGLAGLGTAAVFLVDLRGLFWGLAFVVVSLAATIQGPYRRIPLRAACVLVPVVLAWFAGPLVYTERTIPLEVQMNIGRQFAERGYEDPRFAAHYEGKTRYVWGRSSVLEIPATLKHLWSERDLAPPEGANPYEGYSSGGKDQVTPWIPIMLASLAALAWGTWRRPRLVLGTVGLCVPFLVALKAGYANQHNMVRYLAISLPFVPALMGAAFASLAQGSLARTVPGGAEGEAEGWRHRNRIWWAGCCAVALTLTLGVIPSVLSPTSEWRRYQRQSGADCDISRYTAQALGNANGAAPLSVGCTTAIRREHEQGGPRWVDLVCEDPAAGSGGNAPPAPAPLPLPPPGSGPPPE